MYDDTGCRFFKYSDSIWETLSSKENAIYEPDAIFIQNNDDKMPMELYQTIKSKLSEEEKQVINLFMINHMANFRTPGKR